MLFHRQVCNGFLSLLLCMSALPGLAEDWPTYRHDLSRSGATAEQLDAARLVEAWVDRSAEPPAPAWPGPAKWDAYAGIKNLPSMRNFDPCYHVIAAGDAVYFGSNTDDAVHKLDLKTGERLWSFPTGGPIRVAPLLHDGKLYFGSDDGNAYCIDGQSGKEHWRYSAVPDADKVWNNDRLISFFPVRTGVAVKDGMAYFGASLLPWKSSHLVAVNAETGRKEGAGSFSKAFANQTMEGVMLATDDQLILPQGRVAPRLYDRKTGADKGNLEGSGGVFVVVTPEQHILHGPAGRSSQLGGLSDSSGETAKIAAFEKGNALVVSGHWAFLLQAGQVMGVDRTEGKVVWQQAHDAPLDLVLAGEVLFVGSEDLVTAYNAEDGKVLWQHAVEGRAHGLAVANGALLVSTDHGAIHCFVEGNAAGLQNADQAPEEQAEVLASPDVKRVRARGLLGRWVMHRSAMRTPGGESITETNISQAWVRDQSGKQHAELNGTATSERFGEVEALYLDGKSYLQAAADVSKAKLPRKQMSVEAWVRVDQPLPWGGILGCVQDNGSFERGWLLGFRDNKFCFGAKSTSKEALTYLTANTAFSTGDWAHIVGTYDGKAMRLYVNGRFETASKEQSGPIDYAPTGPFVIGAYRDDDEDFRMTGMIHEARVYNTVLRDRDVAALFEAKSANFPAPINSSGRSGNFLASGPAVRFAGPGAAWVTWRTHRPSSSVVEFIRDDQTIREEVAGRRIEHEVLITGLKNKSVYQFQITQEMPGGPRTTRSFECDTYFNYTHDYAKPQKPIYPKDLIVPAETPMGIVDSLESERGMVLMLGFDDAKHAVELATKTWLNSIVVIDDAEQAQVERLKLIEAGVYGKRVTVLTAQDVAELRLPPKSFNAVLVSNRAENDSALLKQAKSLAQPIHGIVMTDLKKLLYTAPPIEGAGVWSHMYGTPENNSFGGEHLAEAGSIEQLEVQWIGRPGPRYQSDRQNRKPAPLAVGGRLYMQGLHRLITVDQYNGTILWSMEIPEMQRWNVVRDSANWCADDEHLYVTVLGEVWKIKGSSGEVIDTWPALGNSKGEREYDFGYVARVGDLLVGSSVRKGTVFTEWWGGGAWYDDHAGEKAGKVASDAVFVLDAKTGRKRWHYNDALVLNPTICITDDHIFFIVATNPEVVRAKTRRLHSDAMWKGLELVALDLKTGRKLYQKPIKPMPGVTAFYMVHAQDKLLISSSANNKFEVHCLGAKTAKLVWDARFPWQADHHGKHLARPAVSGNYVYLRPKVLDLQTGKDFNITFPGGHQCGTYALTTNAWFARAGSMTMWSIDDKQITRWDRLRTDCWLSTVPAGGMLLSPEGGGGCSCGTWMETSLGFMPRVTRERGARDSDDGGDG